MGGRPDRIARLSRRKKNTMKIVYLLALLSVLIGSGLSSTIGDLPGGAKHDRDPTGEPAEDLVRVRVNSIPDSQHRLVVEDPDSEALERGSSASAEKVADIGRHGKSSTQQISYKTKNENGVQDSLDQYAHGRQPTEAVNNGNGGKRRVYGNEGPQTTRGKAYPNVKENMKGDDQGNERLRSMFKNLAQSLEGMDGVQFLSAEEEAAFIEDLLHEQLDSGALDEQAFNEAMFRLGELEDKEYLDDMMEDVAVEPETLMNAIFVDAASSESNQVKQGSDSNDEGELGPLGRVGDHAKRTDRSVGGDIPNFDNHFEEMMRQYHSAVKDLAGDGSSPDSLLDLEADDNLDWMEDEENLLEQFLGKHGNGFVHEGDQQPIKDMLKFSAKMLEGSELPKEAINSTMKKIMEVFERLRKKGVELRVGDNVFDEFFRESDLGFAQGAQQAGNVGSGGSIPSPHRRASHVRRREDFIRFPVKSRRRRDRLKDKETLEIAQAETLQVLQNVDSDDRRGPELAAALNELIEGTNNPVAMYELAMHFLFDITAEDAEHMSSPPVQEAITLLIQSGEAKHMKSFSVLALLLASDVIPSDVEDTLLRRYFEIHASRSESSGAASSSNDGKDQSRDVKGQGDFDVQGESEGHSRKTVQMPQESDRGGVSSSSTANDAHAQSGRQSADRLINNRELAEEMALDLLTYAADQEEFLACSTLGFWYLYGLHGLHKDCEMAQFYYSTAAKQAIDIILDSGVDNREFPINLEEIWEDPGLAPFMDQDHSAIEYHHSLADEYNDAEAAALLGEVYFFGQPHAGVQVDLSRAVRYFRQAAMGGHAPSQANLGIMYSSGLGVPRNTTAALENFNAASEQGNGLAKLGIAIMYLNGEGVPANVSKAVGLLEEAIESGLSEAHNALGLLYLQGNGVPMNATKARINFEGGMKAGSAQSTYNLGIMYGAGLGIDRSCQKSTLLLKDVAERAPELGQLPFSSSNSWLYYSKEEFEKALQAFSLAAEYGDKTAQENAAFMWEKDIGTRSFKGINGTSDGAGRFEDTLFLSFLPKGLETAILSQLHSFHHHLGLSEGHTASARQAFRFSRAFEYYSLGGKQESVQSLRKLGDCHRDGWGGVCMKNVTAAREYYNQSAAEGDGEAMLQLSRMLAAGEGGHKDLLRARELMAECNAKQFPYGFPCAIESLRLEALTLIEKVLPEILGWVSGRQFNAYLSGLALPTHTPEHRNLATDDSGEDKQDSSVFGDNLGATVPETWKILLSLCLDFALLISTVVFFVFAFVYIIVFVLNRRSVYSDPRFRGAFAAQDDATGGASNESQAEQEQGSEQQDAWQEDYVHINPSDGSSGDADTSAANTNTE